MVDGLTCGLFRLGGVVGSCILLYLLVCMQSNVYLGNVLYMECDFGTNFG